MSDEVYRRILSLTSEWGVRTKWEDIDKVLYGGASSRIEWSKVTKKEEEKTMRRGPKIELSGIFLDTSFFISLADERVGTTDKLKQFLTG